MFQICKMCARRGQFLLACACFVVFVACACVWLGVLFGLGVSANLLGGVCGALAVFVGSFLGYKRRVLAQAALFSEAFAAEKNGGENGENGEVKSAENANLTFGKFDKTGKIFDKENGENEHENVTKETAETAETAEKSNLAFRDFGGAFSLARLFGYICLVAIFVVLVNFGIFNAWAFVGGIFCSFLFVIVNLLLQNSK